MTPAALDPYELAWIESSPTVEGRRRRRREALRRRREEARWEERRAIADADAAVMLTCPMRAAEVRGLTKEECRARRICWVDGKPLPPRRLYWCSDECVSAWTQNHQWTTARHAAMRRDGFRCVRACGRSAREVNHREPRRGRGYHEGCHNHLDLLESLCSPCHLAETNAQRRGAA